MIVPLGGLAGDIRGARGGDLVVVECTCEGGWCGLYEVDAMEAWWFCQMGGSLAVCGGEGGMGGEWWERS